MDDQDIDSMVASLIEVNENNKLLEQELNRAAEQLK